MILFQILDVGCGAGILSEPLARLGANVVGIDSSKEALDAGKLHRYCEHKTRHKKRFATLRLVF